MEKLLKTQRINEIENVVDFFFSLFLFILLFHTYKLNLSFSLCATTKVNLDQPQRRAWFNRIFRRSIE